MENLVFTEDTIITESMTYGDVLLTFNGGSLVNNTGKAITLTGNNTKIVAPPYHIFKGEFNFEGSWVMDKEPVIIGNSGFVAANFNGHNVVCFSSDSHADGFGWRPGDMIVNTGNDSSWTVKVIKE